VLLLLILGFGECAEPPAPPPPPAPPAEVAPAHPPSVRCVPALLPESDAPTSVLRLVLGDGHSQEVGPFPGECRPVSVPGSLCAVRCGTAPDGPVLKAAWDGARLSVWTRPADGTAAWSRVWIATGPQAHH
jgi:hypothetical protein